MELHFLTVFSENPNNPAHSISVEYALNILGARILRAWMRCKGFALLAMQHSKLSVDQRSSHICTQLFTLPIFRNTSESLIYFTVVLALQGVPVVSLWHLRLTMEDNLLSVDFPPSPLMEAGLSNNNMDNVSRTKSTIKNRQGIIEIHVWWWFHWSQGWYWPFQKLYPFNLHFFTLHSDPSQQNTYPCWRSSYDCIQNKNQRRTDWFSVW